MNILKKVLVFILLVKVSVLFSQEQEEKDASVYLEFQRFFQNEIKHQGVKGDWIYELNEITSLHKFDYNQDGILDVLIEFSAKPEDGGSYINYYSVLFEGELNDSFKYINYIDSFNLTFLEYFNSDYIFRNEKSDETLSFILKDNKFIEKE